MTDDNEDRLAAVRQLVRDAVEELEAFDNWDLGWEPIALLREIERNLDRGIDARRNPSRRASVVEFSRRRNETAG